MGYRSIFSIVLIALSVSQIQAQNKDEAKYRKESEEIRKQIWTSDMPEFKVKDIPAKYSNASKVVIARYTELTAESKSKLAFYGLGFGMKKEQSLTEVVREMVKLNDKTAVDEYSELTFTRFQKSSGFFTVDKTTSYIGIRVIKPNGTIKEIAVDDIILTKDESTEKKGKVAIPNLQVGDIIDYFFSTDQMLTNSMATKNYLVPFFDDAPILYVSFHGQLGKKYAVEYRSYNQAPEITVKKNNDDEIIIDVEKKDIPPFETTFWVAPGIQLPFVRMNISLGYSGMGSKFVQARKPGEIYKNKNSQEFINDYASDLSVQYYNNYWMRPAKQQFDVIIEEAKGFAKQMGVSYKELKDEDKAALLFYTFRMSKLLAFNIDNLSKLVNIGDYDFNDLAFFLFCTMKAADLDPVILVNNRNNGVRFSEIMYKSDLSSSVYLPSLKKYFSLNTVYDPAFYIPSYIEGLTETKSFTFDHPAMIMGFNKMAGLTNIANGPKIPVTSSEQNARIEKLKLSLNLDKNLLAVQRNTTLKGHYKSDVQRHLIAYEDLFESERLSFKAEKSLIADLESDKKSRKYADEVKNAFAEARKKQKDAFEKEVKDWFGEEVTDLTNYKTDSLGIRHTSPNFVYSSSFNLGNLAKKAGNNYIIEIGKIQGQPLTVKNEQRNREFDIYMPFARSLETYAELAIPEGYTVEGIADLNKKLENETGYFSAEARITDKSVIIAVKKHYYHIYEPAANWSKLLQFIDAANDWTNSKLLLKKK